MSLSCSAVWRASSAFFSRSSAARRSLRSTASSMDNACTSDRGTVNHSLHGECFPVMLREWGVYMTEHEVLYLLA